MFYKAKNLVSDVAKQLDKPVEEVNDVVDFYYKELRAKMEKLETPRIFVPELGVFYESKKKIEESISKLTVIVNKAKPEKFKEISIIETKKSLIEQQKGILEKVNLKRLEYESKKSLAKQKRDS